MATVYPDFVRGVIDACLAYQAHKISLDALKSEIWKGAMAIASVQEADFRHFLQAAEGRLDILQFTTEDVRTAVIPIVREILDAAHNHMEDDSSGD